MRSLYGGIRFIRPVAREDTSCVDVAVLEVREEWRILAPEVAIWCQGTPVQ